ncbi:MAG: JAB domain-containing protein [bacterium]
MGNQNKNSKYKPDVPENGLEQKIGEKPESFYDGSYHGYSVKLKVVRENSEYKPVQLNTPKSVYNFVKHLENEDREKFISILLDSKNRVLGVDEVSTGSLMSSMVEPREVFKTAILYNSANLIFAHNHPSGDPTPSASDIELTHHLQEGMKLLGIRLLDHIIIGYEQYKSMANEKLI